MHTYQESVGTDHKTKHGTVTVLTGYKIIYNSNMIIIYNLVDLKVMLEKNKVPTALTANNRMYLY